MRTYDGESYKQYSDTYEAKEVARLTGWNLWQWAHDREWSGVGIGPVGQHRDSDSLSKSNFQVILNDLRTRFGNDVDDASYGLFAFGWIAEITYNVGNADLVAAVQEWREKLENYPVADEDHFYELEWEDNHPDCDNVCYSDNDYCECGREKA